MRKFFLLLGAVALMSAAPLSQSFAQVAPAPPLVTQGHHLNAWPVVCGAVSAVSLMAGSEISMTGTPAAKQRQLTITEATWWASACPVFLPLALVTTLACPDNKATVEVARLAYLYTKKKPGADQGAFTNAYTEACKGRLSGRTQGALLRLIG